MAADATAEFLYTSTDFGNTWGTDSPPPQAFAFVASSADGSRLVAASQNNGSFNGPIYISTNSGNAWLQKTAPVTNWVAVASSADGSALVAAGGGSASLGHIYVSKDSGVTWSQASPLLAHWSSVASSADGSKLVASIYGGHIYTLHFSEFTPSPTLTIRPEASQAVVSWPVPSINFVLQKNADLTTSNWSDVTPAPILNLTNLQHEVRMSLNVAHNCYRLISR